jgi:hypothetical protein
MSLMKWFIISTLISMPLMFIFPDNSGFSDKDSQKIMAGLEFNEICSNAALLQNCTMVTAKSAYSKCIEAYGNLTLEDCRSRCCDGNESGLMNSYDFVSMPQIVNP